MKKIHISFGNERFYENLDLLEKTSIEIGKVDQFIRYTQEWLKSTPFWLKNSFILNRPRGAGYWIWKPYIILESFKSLQNDDVVLYSDAALKVIDNITPLFDLTRELPNDGKIIFKVPWIGAQHIAKIWCKRDCFVLMNCDEQKYWEAYMTNGAVSLWVKNEQNIEFLNEWLKLLRDPRIVTDDPNMCGKSNFLEFKDHRHDQSVLSLLSKKYKFEIFRDPTQWGNDEINLFTNSPYPQLFDHYRRNN